jgi:hypothetical protein
VVVHASLSCQSCLRSAVLVEVVVLAGGRGAFAHSHCPLCVTPTEVALTPEQALRLVLAPPAGLAIQIAR